jgi:pyruvate-formate lyase
MKLAEALLERKSVKESIDSLKGRLQTNASVQEGDRPSEEPESLLAELKEALAQLEGLIKRINATNNAARLPDGATISEAIVRRDMLKLEREALEGVATQAEQRHNRYSRSEVKFVPTVDAAALRRRMDELAKQWRELDAQIQAVNWTAELA